MAEPLSVIVHVIDGEARANHDKIYGCQDVKLDIEGVQEQVEVSAGDPNVMWVSETWFNVIAMSAIVILKCGDERLRSE